MSMVDMSVLSGSLQTLVDARLDAVDRALLGRTSRQERLNVVGEVEARIHELLHERCGGAEPSRDDVLAVLGRLDPPEAYLAEDLDDEAPRASRPRSQAPALAPAISPRSRFARQSAMLGLISLAMVLLAPLSYPLCFLVENEVPLMAASLAAGLFMVVGGVASVALAIFSRLSDGWAIVGAAAGCLAPMIAIASVLVLFL
jgi:hypothetical protein